jgi:hypothetical protein
MMILLLLFLQKQSLEVSRVCKEKYRVFPAKVCRVHLKLAPAKFLTSVQRIFSSHNKNTEQILSTRLEIFPTISDGQKNCGRLEISPAVSYGPKNETTML